MRLRWLRRLARDRRGATTLLTAGMATSAIAALAFAVDLGALYHESRRLQGIADGAALSAALQTDSAETAARAAIAANSLSQPYTLAVQTGLYRPDAAIAPAARFLATTGAKNAARVTITSDARLFFGVTALGKRTLPVTRTATATRTNLAAFSIGSRLASLNGGLANALLSALTGSKISLSAMDYAALAAADIDLLTFADALRTEAKLKAVSFDQTLAARLAPPRVLTALAASLDQSGLGAAATAVRKIVDAGITGDSAPLSRLIDLGAMGAQDRAAPGPSLRVSAFDLARGVLEIAGGPRQVKLDLAATIPGLTSTIVYVAIGERPAGSPWVALTPSGEPVIRTAQTRIYVDASLLPGVLAPLGVGGIRLPLYVELAEGQAKLSSIRCNQQAGTRAASLDVKPGIGHVSIADVQPSALGNFNSAPAESPAQIVKALLLTVSGQARVDLSSSDWKRVDFTTAEVDARKVKTVQSSGVVQGITASLIRSISLNVGLGPIGLGLGAVTGLVGIAIAPAGPILDELIGSLTGMLGVGLGEADVRINGVRCGQAALVA